MSRALLVFTVIAGVAWPTLADAAPKKSAAVVAKEKRAKAKKAALAEKKRRKAIRDARAPRKPTKKSLARMDNMPRGFAWPPTRQMLEAEKACEAKLDELGVAYKPAARDGRIVNAITLSDDGNMTIGGIKYVSAFRKGAQKLDCQLALALTSFGPQLEELGVTQVTFGSIFRFTNVRVMGKTKNVLSRHALGIAMDIVSFTDKDGRVALVGKDYKTGDELLLGIENVVNESGLFRLLLTPKNDPISHSDHFHLEVATDYTAPTS